MEKFISLESEIEMASEVFSDAFYNILASISQVDKQRVMTYAPAIFRRWYHAALVNETCLSPVNLLDAASRSEKNTSGPILTLKTSPLQNDKIQIQPFYPSQTKESILQKDLKILAEFCLPDVALDQNGQLREETFRKLMPKLSFDDPFYGQFLMEYARKTGLLVPMPSIHSLRAQTSFDRRSMLDLSPEEFLESSVSSVMEIALEKITEKIPELSAALDQNTWRELFLSSEEPDELLSGLFQFIGIDAEKIITDYEQDTLNEQDEVYLPYIFTAGVLLDKWLFTPLDSYLGLVQVLYAGTMDLREELNFVLTDLNLERDLSPSIFSLCTSFRYTDLGRRLLRPNSAKEPFLPENVPHQQIIRSLKEEQKLDRQKEALHWQEKVSERICCFRICFLHDKSYWKTIEIEDRATIRELHEQISLLFGLDESSAYTFTFIDQRDCVHTFVSSQTVQNSQESVLSALHFLDYKKLTYTSSFDRCLSIGLEFLGYQPKYHGLLYPRITGQSPQAKQEEDFLTF